MSFFTSFQELLDFDHSTNLNGFHFSNSLFGFDSNSLPTLENLPPPVPAPAPTSTALDLPPPPSPIHLARNPSPLLETPTKLTPLAPPGGPQLSPEVLQNQHQHHHHYNHHVPQQQQQQQQQSSVATPLPLPIVSKFQLKVTPNNEIYISNESGTFCELAGSFVPSSPLRASPELVLEEEEEDVPEPEPEPAPEPPKTLYCIERSGLKRPLSPSDRRYGASGIFHVRGSPNKKKSTSAGGSNGGAAADGHGSAQPEGAKLVVSNVINNGLIVNKKHLSTTGEEPVTNGHHQPAAVTPERRIMRPKKRKRKIPPKAGVVTLEAKLEPVVPPNGTGRIVTRIVPKVAKSVPVVAAATATTTTPESTLNFSGIKEKAAQEAIFTEKVPEVVVAKPQPVQQLPVKKNGLNGTSLVSAAGGVVAAAKEISTSRDEQVPEVREIKVGEDGAVAPTSPGSPVELKVVADLVMDKEVFGHISLLNTSPDLGKTVIYQNPVTSRNVIYSILNPKSLNLALAGVDRSTTATLTLQPHRGGRKPKKRGRKPKALTTEGVPEQEGAAAAAEPIDPSVPVMVTRSGRLSKPPRYANNFFQNMKQAKGSTTEVPSVSPLDPPPPPPPLPPPLLPDPETAEKLPNFSAALNSVTTESASTTAAAAAQQKTEHQQLQQVQKRKMTVPLQYRCATCNKIYLGKRMQRHLQKYPSHNSARDCGKGEGEREGETGVVKKDKEEKSTYLYKHLFDLLQRFTEKDKGRIMLKEISNFVDFVRALIPRLITNDEQNSTVEYIDHNVADVLRLNHGKYRLKLSSLAEEYEKLNLTVNLLDGDSDEVAAPTIPITSTPNADRQSGGFSFNADDLLNQSSSFPSLTTLMHEHHVLNTMLAPAPATTNNNHYMYNNNNNNVPQQQQLTQHYTHHHHPTTLLQQEDPAMPVALPGLAGLCKSPVQHHHHHHHHHHAAASAGMVNMALNLY